MVREAPGLGLAKGSVEDPAGVGSAEEVPGRGRPMMEARRSEGKFGSGGESRAPRRQVRRGSWMNWGDWISLAWHREEKEWKG